MEKIMLRNAYTIKIVGYVLFAVSFVIWGAIFMLPFFIKDVPKVIAVNAILFIISEGSFVLSILILDKEFWQKIKSFFTNSIKKINSK